MEERRTMPDTRYNTLLERLAIAAFCLFVVLGALSYGIINTNNRARESQEGVTRGVNCVLAELEAHRINSYKHFREDPMFDGKAPVITPEDLKKVVGDACKGFLVNE